MPARLVVATKLDAICSAFCYAIESLGAEDCPQCGQRTLSVEFVIHSGLRVTCGGYDPKATNEDGACEFSRFALLSQYRDVPKPTP